MKFLNNIIKNKKVKFYAAMDREAAKSESHGMLTITATKDEALEYLNVYLKKIHSSHYTAWCDLHNLSSTNPMSWEKYFNECITPAEKHRYFICRQTFRIKNLVVLLRMFGGCIPIGCSFDILDEYKYLEAKSAKFRTESKVEDNNECI